MSFDWMAEEQWLCDLRLASWPARDQDAPDFPPNACVAFATTALHERARFIDELIDLSELSLVFAMATDTAKGVALTTAFTALRQQGQLSRTDCSDALKSVDGSELLSLNGLWWRKAVMKRIDATPEEIASLLTQGSPVLLGLRQMESLSVPDDRGIVRSRAGDRARGRIGHAVSVVGSALIDGEVHLLIRNSWGESWGQAGYAFLASAYVRNHGLTAAVVGSLLPAI